MAEAKKWLKGHLLLDSGQLTGSFFHRTVVLICQHDADGAFGLVLNRPSGKKVGDALVADLTGSIKDQPLFLGGPVQTTALSYVHTDALLLEGNVTADLSMGHSVETLEEIGQSFSPAKKLKVFAGYSGWSPGQLEDELKRKAWVVHPASLEYVFYDDSKGLWREILKRKGGMFRLLSQIPEDLSWN